MLAASALFSDGVATPVAMRMTYSLSGLMRTVAPSCGSSSRSHRSASARAVSSAVLLVCSTAPR